MFSKINPKKLFLIDSIGALISAFMLGVVLVKFENIIGMPKEVLYFLSFLACVFSVYSFLCFLRVKEDWQVYMRVIGIVNSLYCFLTIGLIIYWYQRLTALGIMYFVLELIILVILVNTELKISLSRIDKNS